MKAWVVLSVLALGAAASGQSPWDEIVQSKVDAQHKAIQRLSDLLGQIAEMDSSREELEESGSDTSPVVDASQESSDKMDKEKDDSDEKAVAFPNVFNILRNDGGLKPWWQGSNVCVEKDVKSEGNETEEAEPLGGFFVLGTAQFSSCKHTTHKYICTTILKTIGKTTTTTVTYQCCPGYSRSPAAAGCEKFEIKKFEDVGESMGAVKFANLINKISMESGNATIFLPSDDSVNLEEMESEMKNAIEINSILPELEEITRIPPSPKHHIVPGKIVHSYDLENNLILKTMDDRQLRVNVYPYGVTTVNCVPLGKTLDVMTDKGIAHSVTAPIPTTRLSLADILSRSEYSQFKMLLKENDLFETLKGDGPFTVFALTDTAMEKSRVVNQVCLKRILQHHILPSFMCSALTKMGNVTALDLASDWVTIRNFNDTITLDNQVKVTKVDILATNGVIYHVDDVIIPDRAVSLTGLLKRVNHTGVLDLFKKANLLKELNMRQNITVLVPSEDSLAPLNDLSVEELKKALLYHIMEGKKDSWAFKDKSHVTAVDGGDLYVRMFRNLLSFEDPKPAFNCVPVTRQNGHVCNGVVHEVARPIMKPEKSMYDIIQTDPELSLMKRLIEGTDLEVGLKKGVFKETTILALPNEFEEADPETTKKLLEDKELANRQLRKRMLTQALCCSTVVATQWPFTTTVQTLTPNWLVTNRRGDNVYIGQEKVRTCDIVATDGLIHIMDKKAGGKSRGDTEVIFQLPQSEVILGGFDFH